MYSNLILISDMILYVPVNIFSVTSGLVFLGLTSTKHRIKCLAQGQNVVLPVRLEPVDSDQLTSSEAS